MLWQKFIPIVKHSLNYNPYLDGLRGVAILLVVLFHVWPTFIAYLYAYAISYSFLEKVNYASQKNQKRRSFGLAPSG